MKAEIRRLEAEKARLEPVESVEGIVPDYDEYWRELRDESEESKDARFAKMVRELTPDEVEELRRLGWPEGAIDEITPVAARDAIASGVRFTHRSETIAYYPAIQYVVSDPVTYVPRMSVSLLPNIGELRALWKDPSLNSNSTDKLWKAILDSLYAQDGSLKVDIIPEKLHIKIHESNSPAIKLAKRLKFVKESTEDNIETWSYKL